jgi:AhpD family alkylhydroperoxidase
MSNRIDPRTLPGRPIAQVKALFGYVHGSSLEPTLVELVELRASQINGCAYCMAMHTPALLAHGVSAQKVAVLPAWREVEDFTPREKAALAWTEYLTRIADTAFVPDAVYNAAREAFTEEELVDLTWAVTTINMANRFNVAFQVPPEQG